MAPSILDESPEDPNLIIYPAEDRVDLRRISHEKATELFPGERYLCATGGENRIVYASVREINDDITNELQKLFPGVVLGFFPNPALELRSDKALSEHRSKNR